MNIFAVTQQLNQLVLSQTPAHGPAQADKTLDKWSRGDAAGVGAPWLPRGNPQTSISSAPSMDVCVNY